MVYKGEWVKLRALHLDGLRVAGEEGWDIALSGLERWRGSGEAFVCVLLALESALPGERLRSVFAQIEADPERMLRGVISALAWAEPGQGEAWMARWVADPNPPVLQVAAWRALRLNSLERCHDFLPFLPSALASPHAPVRAAGCRLAGDLRDYERLRPLLSDPDGVVRAEAAIAFASHDAVLSASPLWRCVAGLTGELAALSGRPRRDAQHRLVRWVRQLGLIVPIGHPGVALLLQQLPVRLGLQFVLHHGDGSLLPWVAGQADNPDVARLAGWVWATLTGVDLDEAGLARPPVRLDDGQAIRPTDDLDPGLSEPDAAALRAAAIALPGSGPCLLGAELTRERLLDLLHGAPQGIRWIAAQRLRLNDGSRFDTRAPAFRQIMQLRQLGQA